MVDVAQLVEHQIVALRVVGSSPTIHPIFYYSYVWLVLIKRQFQNLSNSKKIIGKRDFKIFLKYLKNRLHYFHQYRGVAQLVAHSLWERGVVSSSLATPTSLRLSGPTGSADFVWRGHTSSIYACQLGGLRL